jgi:hypothetical protein
VYFELSFEDFATLTKKLCAYCERPPLSNARGYAYNGLDRINPVQGYFKENLNPCCWECNRMKSNLYTAEETRAMAQALKALRLQKKTG